MRQGGAEVGWRIELGGRTNKILFWDWQLLSPALAHAGEKGAGAWPFRFGLALSVWQTAWRRLAHPRVPLRHSPPPNLDRAGFIWWRLAK